MSNVLGISYLSKMGIHLHIEQMDSGKIYRSLETVKGTAHLKLDYSTVICEVILTLEGSDPSALASTPTEDN